MSEFSSFAPSSQDSLDVTLRKLLGLLGGVASSGDNAEVTSRKILSYLLNSNLPASGVKLVTVADQAARYALTAEQVNIGDIVIQTDTGNRYLVTNTENLDSYLGYADLGKPQPSQYVFATTDAPNLDSGFSITGGTFSLTNGNLTIDTPETVTSISVIRPEGATFTLSNLNFDGLTELTFLDLAYVTTEQIDISPLTKLTSCGIRGASLTSFTVPNAIISALDLTENALTTLVVPSSVTNLQASGNALTTIDMSAMVEPQYINLIGNALESVDGIINFVAGKAVENNFESGELYLSGGTNAAPTAASAAALVSLASLNWSVSTN